MPINTIANATILQTTLDKQVEQQSVTGWMEANASLARYNGGAEVRIPKMGTAGLANYDRDAGYTRPLYTSYAADDIHCVCLVGCRFSNKKYF